MTEDAVPMDRIFGVFKDGQAPGLLSALSLALLDEQKKTWPACRKGYASLAHVMERKIDCKGFSVRVQHNPGRMTSTLADVRQEGVRSRPCFLCSHNRPEGQKAVLYRDEYLVLCNPMPVFSAHFTIPLIAHEPQSIAGRAGALLRLTEDFGPSFRLLYNGPKCGASAPDHMHFQAAPARVMPVEGEVRKAGRVSIPGTADVSVSLARGIGREVVILQSGSRAALEGAFSRFTSALAEVLGVADEPMMNIICFRAPGQYTMLLFPRAKHRPDAFYLNGEDCLSVSPAVAEVGGIIVTPREKDFGRIDASLVEDIFREVSLDRRTVEQAIGSMG